MPVLSNLEIKHNEETTESISIINNSKVSICLKKIDNEYFPFPVLENIKPIKVKASIKNEKLKVKTPVFVKEALNLYDIKNVKITFSLPYFYKMETGCMHPEDPIYELEESLKRDTIVLENGKIVLKNETIKVKSKESLMKTLKKLMIN